MSTTEASRLGEDELAYEKSQSRVYGHFNDQHRGCKLETEDWTRLTEQTSRILEYSKQQSADSKK